MGKTDTVGKAELATALGWSRPRLDTFLKTHADAPVISRGAQGGGWKFSLAGFRAYLSGGKRPAIDLAQLAEAVKPPDAKPARRSAHHEGEATARQRKDAADASLKETKLADLRGELIEAEQARQVLAAMFARMGKGIDALPEQIVRLTELPDTAIARLRPLMDDIRTQMVQDCQSLLTPTSAASSPSS